jgi:hypothetical protein
MYQIPVYVHNGCIVLVYWVILTISTTWYIKVFEFYTRRCYLVRDERYGTACVSHHQGLNLIQRMMSGGRDYIETLMMGHTGSPEMLVSDQITTPAKNPKSFIHQDNRGESLQ